MRFGDTDSDFAGDDVGAVMGISRGLVRGILTGRGEPGEGIIGYSRVIRRLESGGVEKHLPSKLT